MRRLAPAFVLAAAITAPAHAAPRQAWVSIDEGRMDYRTELFADLNSIRRTGDIATGQVIYAHRNRSRGATANWAAFTYRVDCAKKELTELSEAGPMARPLQDVEPNDMLVYRVFCEAFRPPSVVYATRQAVSRAVLGRR